MTLVAIIGALAVALVSAAAAAAAVWRANSTVDARVAEAVLRAVEELAEAAGRPGERFVGELAASLDLDEVAERTLDTTGAIPGVEAAILEFAAPDGGRQTAAIGIAGEELQQAAVQVPENDNLRAVEVVFRYRPADADAGPNVVRSGLAVPVRADGQPVGTLTVFTRSSKTKLGDPQLDELEQLALVLFDLDDFKAINDRIGHLSGDAVLAEVATRTMTAVRSADIACRVGGDEFGIVLPESGGEDGELLAARVARAVGAHAIGKAGTLYLSAGVAKLREGDTAVALFERADEALYRAKDLGKARTVTAENAS